MNLQDTQNRISYLMSIFVTEVKFASAMRQTDIKTIAETVLIKLFKEVYGYCSLVNLNIFKENYPAIDLGDETARVCFQITSTSDVEKIKSTLQKFVEYNLYEKYDRLIVYIISEKQKSYTSKTLKDITQGKLNFDVKNDIQDSSDLLKMISNFQIDKADRIRKLLEDNFGEGKNLIFHEAEKNQTELLSLNLIKIYFPKTLYTANLSNKSKSISNNLSTSSRQKINSKREPVKDALASKGLRFGIDWEYFENKLITFHDLQDPNLPLSQIVDKKTISEFDSQKFFNKNESHERVFKSLLRKCLQQKLFQQKVIWQHEERLFMFSDIDGEIERKEHWQGERASSRAVYNRIQKKDKPLETLHHKHLAFKIQFRRFGSNWYLLIKPEWFFSFDGYRKSFYSKKNVDWLKKKENNDQVFNHFRFISYFLSNNEPLEISKRTYPFLSFVEPVTFDNAPFLDDQEWNPPKFNEKESENTDPPLFKL